MKHFITEYIVLRAAALFTCLAFPAIAISADVTDFDVFGLKLGMTPDQVTSIFKQSGEDYQVNSSPFTSHGRDFIGRVNAFKRSTNSKSNDYIFVDFAPPPHANVVVSVKRSRNYDPSEGMARENVRGALIKKYGQPEEDNGYFFDWNKVPKNCAQVKAYMSSKNGYILQDNGVIATLNRGETCPTTMAINLYTRGDAVSGIVSLLIDYPTLQVAARENSQLAREWKAEQARKVKNRGGPSDL